MNTAIISAVINSEDIHLLKALLKRFEAKSIKIEKNDMHLVQFREKVEALRLNKKEFLKVTKICKKHGWGLTVKRGEKLIKAHKKAFHENNPKQAMFIETELTEMNFHSLVKFLIKGEYLSALENFKKDKENLDLLKSPNR